MFNKRIAGAAPWCLMRFVVKFDNGNDAEIQGVDQDEIDVLLNDSVCGRRIIASCGLDEVDQPNLCEAQNARWENP
jgi:hypothetical protein